MKISTEIKSDFRAYIHKELVLSKLHVTIIKI